MELIAYREHLDSVKAKPTVTSYIRSAKLFIEFLSSEDWKIETMPVYAVQQYMDSISKRFAGRSLRTYYYGIRHYLAWLKGRGIEFSEQTKADMPRAKDPKRILFSMSQIVSILKYSRGIDDPPRTALILMLASGVRVSELCSLKLSDLQVKTVGNHKHLMLRIVHGKRGKSRMVPVMKFAAPFVKNYAKHMKRTAEGWLFPSPKNKGSSISTSAILRWTKIAARKLKFKMHPHAFRRTYATMLLESGIGEIALQRILGHENLDTTSMYANPSDAFLADAVERAEGTLWERISAESPTKKK
jgi:integrase/recombinase XerD